MNSMDSLLSHKNSKTDQPGDVYTHYVADQKCLIITDHCINCTNIILSFTSK